MLRDSADRTVIVLAICQGLMMASTSTLIAEASLVGHALAENKALATLPLALQQFAVMATALPASLAMQRWGRRAGFLTGAAAGMVAALVTTWGALIGSFPLFCSGVALNGVYNGIANGYRFAAAECVPVERRPRAISWVMAGGVLAAVAGPELAKHTRDILAVPFAGSFLSLAGVAALALALLAALRLPPPVAADAAGPHRPWREIASQPAFVVALAGGIAAYGVMTLVMNATPLAMVGCGHSFDDSALVIQLHLLAMFVPSFWTGNVIRRCGLLTTMAAGAALLLAAGAVNLAGLTLGHFAVGLALLGLGWNFLFIGATALLTETWRPAERAAIQGVNDMLIWGVMGIAAFSAGVLNHAVGWAALNLLAVPFVAGALMATGWLARRRRAPA